LLLSAAYPSYGQSRAELERQRKQKERDIAQTKKRLAETNEKQKKTLAYLNDLTSLIKQREELIGTLQNQLHIINVRIDQESDIVSSLEHDLDTLKKEYARLLYFMYKNNSANNMLSFVFASSSFNEAIKRIKFIEFYTDYRKKQMALIVSTKKSIVEKLTSLQEEEKAKEEVLATLNEQKKSLENDKQEQARLMQNLKGQEKDLRKQLKEQQRIANRLDQAIRNIIARELAAANRKVKTKAPKIPGQNNNTNTRRNSPSGEQLTPENAKLSAEFSSNRSRLPWPVDRGAISEHFGLHEHPSIANVTVNNSGVKIKTPANTKARCIFDGVVASVVKIPGAKKAVIIRHGGYFTVYSNLDDVYVHAGEKVHTKQDIGVVGTNTINGETEMELQIWQGGQKLNPENWILRR
jgi:septal ring factor EnvC (AmiA/AmiB activator)